MIFKPGATVFKVWFFNRMAGLNATVEVVSMDIAGAKDVARDFFPTWELTYCERVRAA